MTNAEWLINKKGITDFENLDAAESGYNMYEILNEDGDVIGEQYWTGVNAPEVVLLHWLCQEHNEGAGPAKSFSFLVGRNALLTVNLKKKFYYNGEELCHRFTVDDIKDLELKGI